MNTAPLAEDDDDDAPSIHDYAALTDPDALRDALIRALRVADGGRHFDGPVPRALCDDLPPLNSPRSLS